jgi:2-dehydro-3-deoxygluconokinase
MVVTVGEAMMVFNGPPAEPLGVASALRATFAGAESNVAIGLARLGHAARYLSVVGDDLFGHAIVKTLRGEGVDVAGVRFSGERPTGVMFKNRWPGDEPQVLYYRGASAFAAAGAETFEDGLWRDAKLVYLTGITPALSASCAALWRRVAEDAHARGVPVWLDPNYRKKLWPADAFRRAMAELMPFVDTVLPGVSEGETITGKKADVGEIACKLMGMGAKHVVVKGATRAAAYSAEGVTTADAFALERVIDPIGAGDAFAAGYLSGTLEGLPVAERLRRGHAAAAMVCLTNGDWEGLPTRGQLEAFLARRGEADR